MNLSTSSFLTLNLHALSSPAALNKVRVNVMGRSQICIFYENPYLGFGPVVELARLSVVTLAPLSEIVVASVVDVGVVARIAPLTAVPTVVVPAVRSIGIGRFPSLHPQAISAKVKMYFSKPSTGCTCDVKKGCHSG